MQLDNRFTVPVPVSDAWAALMNLEDVANCIPGATLDSTSGEEFAGRIRVKMGPVQLTYNGEGRFIERNEDLHRAVIEASGKETKGSGVVRAQTTATLQPIESGTDVHVLTELSVTGKAAQFGRGVMEDVSARIFDQFAQALATQLADDALTTRQTSGLNPDQGDDKPSKSAPPLRTSSEAINLLSVAGGPIAKRLALPLAAIALLIVVAIVVIVR